MGTVELLPYAPWVVWIIPILASLLVPLMARMGKRIREFFVILVSLLTLSLAISMVPDIYFGTMEIPTDVTASWIPVLSLRVGVLVDPLSMLFANLIAFLGFVVLVYSLDYMAHEEGLTRYYFLMLLFIGAMIGLVMADNFIQMYVFWELVGFCSYALVSFWYRRPEAVKAGMKVFVMTRVGDVALLVGILLLYINLGTFSFLDLFAQTGKIALPLLTLVSFLMLIGAVAKSAQLPLHTWLYSAMAAPTSVSCLLHGATMVKAGVYLIARTHIMFSGVSAWLTAVAWIGALTAFIGATLALHTPDIKGVPAYSTVSQIGYMITALGVAPSALSSGWFAGLFHLLSHAFFQGLGFLAIGSIIHQLGTRDMRKMGGLRRDMPITFVLCLVVILTRSGIPPFAGFFSKGLIAGSIWSTGNIPLIFLIYVATAVTFAYSLRFLLLTFFGEKSDYARKVHVHEAPALMIASSSVLAVLCVIFGFFEPFLIRFMHINLVFDVSRLVSLESLMFLLVLFVGGFPTYLVYYRKSIPVNMFRRGGWKLVDKILEKDYYIDEVYHKIFIDGIIWLSQTLHRFIEVAVIDAFNYAIAKLTIMVSGSAYKYSELKGIDAFNYALAKLTVRGCQYIRKTHTGALFYNMLAVFIVFVLLIILLFISRGFIPW